MACGVERSCFANCVEVNDPLRTILHLATGGAPFKVSHRPGGPRLSRPPAPPMLWLRAPGTAGIHTHFLPACPPTQWLLEKGNQGLSRILSTLDDSWVPILSSETLNVLLPFLFAVGRQGSKQTEGGPEPPTTEAIRKGDRAPLRRRWWAAIHLP